MPHDNTSRALEAAYGELLDLTLESRKRILARLVRLEPGHPDTLAYAAKALLQVQFKQAELADAVGTNQTTIGRWAKNQTISRSEPYRRFAVDALTSLLTASIENPLSPAIAAKDPVGTVQRLERRSATKAKRQRAGAAASDTSLPASGGAHASARSKDQAETPPRLDQEAAHEEGRYQARRRATPAEVSQEDAA